MHGETLCMKSEYRSGNGSIDAYIVSSGEKFWGGTNGPVKQRNIEVLPVTVVTDYSDTPGFIEDKKRFRTQIAEEMTRDELINRLCEYAEELQKLHIILEEKESFE